MNAIANTQHTNEKKPDDVSSVLRFTNHHIDER